MTATQQNLLIEQNADFETTFAVTTDGTTPMNLTGANARLQVRNFYASNGGIVLLEASTANGRITIDGPQGLVHVWIRGHQTAQLDTGVIGKYDLLLYLPNGKTIRLVQGSVSISRGVTMGAWGASF